MFGYYWRPEKLASLPPSGPSPNAVMPGPGCGPPGPAPVARKHLVPGVSGLRSCPLRSRDVMPRCLRHSHQLGRAKEPSGGGVDPAASGRPVMPPRRRPVLPPGTSSESCWCRGILTARLGPCLVAPFHSDRVGRARPRVHEEVSANAWPGLVALIQARIRDGSLAHAFPRRACPDQRDADYRPIETFTETISAVIGLEFYRIS
jgi:hypothetical protein